LAFALLYSLSGSSQQTNLGGFMKKSTMILGMLMLLPALSQAQVFSWEGGRAIDPGSVVACNSYENQCNPEGSCTRVCVSFISISQLTNVILGQANRSASIEQNLTSVRQEFQPSIAAHANEINSIKSTISSAQLQRMIQKAVREELNQRGL
jgi:hypothetical protein